MNKQLINKYKPEFDYFLNEGKILYKHINSNAWWNDEPWNYSPDYVTAIIINDEYSIYRKALIEGKIIQFYDVTEQHETDPSLDKYGWRDFKSFTASSTFSKTPDLYRIKPDEPKFKVGDFVRYVHSTPAKVLEINNVNGNRYYFTNSEMSCLKHELELWTPVKGEWCWFWDKCTPHRPTLRQYDIFPEGSGEENMFHDSEQNPFDFCEPFLNSRPSHLKDK